MGKRTQQTFVKSPRDFYPTVDKDAVTPLLPFIDGMTYCEPCVGAGDLVSLIGDTATCIESCDTDAEKIGATRADVFITNPPFSWTVLQPIMDNLMGIAPTWLLLPADVAHNKRMAPYMERCRWFLSVGRLYWMENKVKGVDNYAWFCFDANFDGVTSFVGRE